MATVVHYRCRLLEEVRGNLILRPELTGRSMPLYSNPYFLLRRRSNLVLWQLSFQFRIRSVSGLGSGTIPFTWSWAVLLTFSNAVRLQLQQNSGKFQVLVLEMLDRTHATGLEYINKQPSHHPGKGNLISPTPSIQKSAFKFFDLDQIYSLIRPFDFIQYLISVTLFGTFYFRRASFCNTDIFSQSVKWPNLRRVN